MSTVVELFGRNTRDRDIDWPGVVSAQTCPFTDKACYKVRKSSPDVSIGTCTVEFGRAAEPVVICPTRLIDRGTIFEDCVPLLLRHEEGDELHVVPEVRIPGGSVDYMLVSVRDGSVVDFVGIEIQTVDTTGTVWPARQRTLADLGVPRTDDAENSSNGFAMNWKMSAKTILMQMHHKAMTFEHLGRKLVLVVQDRFLDYMSGEFRFGHFSDPADPADPVHLHAYSVAVSDSGLSPLVLAHRTSTDATGIQNSLDIQAEMRIEFPEIAATLTAKVSDVNRLRRTPASAPVVHESPATDAVS